jgi:hypothetical protein
LHVCVVPTCFIGVFQPQLRAWRSILVHTFIVFISLHHPFRLHSMIVPNPHSPHLSPFKYSHTRPSLYGGNGLCGMGSTNVNIYPTWLINISNLPYLYSIKLTYIWGLPKGG